MDSGSVIAAQILHHMCCIAVKGGVIHEAEDSGSYIDERTFIRFVPHASDSEETEEGVDSAKRDKLIRQTNRPVLERKSGKESWKRTYD